MEEEENIVAYLLWVDEFVNTIIGLGEKFEESMVVKKVLRSLSLRFDSKVSIQENRKDLDSFKMDELHKICIAYEMRIENEKAIKKGSSL